jgi:hypothetical protein
VPNRIPRKSHGWRLADVLLDEGLEVFVRSRRDSGVSWRRIVRELYEVTDCQVDVAPETLRSWIPDPAPNLSPDREEVA